MTEKQWWTVRKKSQFMFRFLLEKNAARSKVGRRKLRLFACGCCRLVWKHFENPTWRNAVETAERFSDGLATKEELASAREAISEHGYGSFSPDSPGAHDHTIASMVLSATEPQPATAAFHPTAFPMPLAGHGYGTLDGDETLCELLRCIFANVVRPIAIDPRWRTSNVVDLAQAIYQERAFEKMPILADALMDAGCHSEEIIQHCRGDGPHVLGCWAVDSMLGKE